MQKFIMDNLNIILIYLLIINIVGFFAMGIDKFKSKRNMWRIKEQTLFTIALIGGSVGAIIGMYTFRHKTKHNSFVYGMPVILVVQIVGIIYMLKI